ncbi:MAG: hypothetical protein ACREPI_01540 [Candidatus Dormibacterales bacterium]
MDALASAFAGWAAQAAGAAMTSLSRSLGTRTEPDLGALAQTYDRMLAIALLLTGLFVACALVERLLGGPSGAGWSVLPRTLLAVLVASSGLGLAAYLEHYAALIASAWSPGLAFQAISLPPAAQGMVASSSQLPLGSVAGLILTALLTLLLALLVYVELILRAALILVTVSFIPLVSVMSIWPRLAGAAGHLAEFLLGLFLSKFVIATSIYVGFGLVLRAVARPGADAGHANAMVVGVATLAVAALAPVVLVQGVRFGHTATGTLARGWGATAAGPPLASAGRVIKLGRRARSAGHLAWNQVRGRTRPAGSTSGPEPR